ncbi:MAG: gliding motility lipoprotein GldD [Flavobacteriaceae bacterium CG02_land_8_20_14_3_00_34_13]|nr:gliding motility lipoprotein GldD [Flavobacteriia bacterium]PIV48755.1 MAG: gliding motility lipoprotein GldD [Flavobacteriaceae bacterium CG02_land_8_20_14_3_00_34_13]PJC07034.1 MAG: gliding motility lipoprotein GldD [Flavobacteriaceae bacterium CG_4_9_14_0_8_um_filter_34_30]
MKYFFALFSLLVLLSCNEEVIIKPKAMLRLEYPKPSYQKSPEGCPFVFDINREANLNLKNNCWINLEYPKMKATIYMTYRQVKNHNLDSLLFDAQKLTYDHTIKASTIFEQPRVDSIHKVYGMLYMINGNAATPSQFYVTDSVHHFITGSLYFNSKPNFDSVYPATAYLREDIRRIMETIVWKN